ncbi:MAG: phosphoribosyltransferase family protein [Anaerolineaceae bacterium]
MEALSIPQEYLGDVVASADRIQSTVKRVAKELYYGKDYANQLPILLCLRDGAVPFHQDLTKALDNLGFAYESAWLKTHHIYEGTEGSGEVNIFPYKGPVLKDRLVVIVEDIIDTSETILRVCNYLDQHGVAQRNICTFLFKERPANIKWRSVGLNGFGHLPEVRHVGLFIEPLFVVGYGLDYNEFGRDGQEIRVLTPEGQAWVESQIRA